MRSRYVNKNFRRDTSDKAIAWAMELLSYDDYGRCDAYMLEGVVVLAIPPDSGGYGAATYAWKLDDLINAWNKYGGDKQDDDNYDDGPVTDELMNMDLLEPAFFGEPTV